MEKLRVENDHVLEKIIAVLNRFPQIHKAVLFGSRARGDHRTQSDYDIAVYPSGRFMAGTQLRAALDDLDTLYKIDLVIADEDTEAALLKNIEEEGVIILEQENKRENYCKAVFRLHEAFKEYGENPSETMRDGVIQRFEFTTELAWKACREYLVDLGYAEVNGPKPVMREAFAHGMVTDGEAWIRILTDRNLTSHVYKAEIANEIFAHIQTEYMKQFDALVQYFRENRLG